MSEGKGQLRILVLEDEAKVAGALRVLTTRDAIEDRVEALDKGKLVKRRIAMKRIVGILAMVAAVSVLIWVFLESREGRYSSFASQPETPALQQSAGASFTYNFDGDAVGALPAKFHSARTGRLLS